MCLTVGASLHILHLLIELAASQKEITVNECGVSNRWHSLISASSVPSPPPSNIAFTDLCLLFITRILFYTDFGTDFLLWILISAVVTQDHHRLDNILLSAVTRLMLKEQRLRGQHSLPSNDIDPSINY